MLIQYTSHLHTFTSMRIKYVRIWKAAEFSSTWIGNRQVMNA